jgi:hypothetical protein
LVFRFGTSLFSSISCTSLHAQDAVRVKFHTASAQSLYSFWCFTLI